MLDVQLGRAISFEHLTIFPLFAPGAPDLPYDVMADALAGGTLVITEVGSGTVPVLVAINKGDRHTLVIDGEQLIGSRQNRMTNRTILLAANSTTEIPVFCMEQGRWHFTSSEMTSAPQHSPSKLRRRARDAEARLVAFGAEASTQRLSEEQGGIWHDVADTMSKLGAQSDTGSLDAAYQHQAQRMTQWLAAFDIAPDQVGLLAFAGERPLGLDVIGAPRLYARLHERLLRGYILDALEHAGGAGARTIDAPGAQAFLDAVRTARRNAAPTVGMGTYHVLHGSVVGGELRDDDQRVAHLSAFAAQRDTRGTMTDAPPHLAPPSVRRRYRS